MMRVRIERDFQGCLFRFFMAQWSEMAYIRLGLSGLQLEVEFPSDWHEHRMGWVRLGVGFGKVCFGFPWPWVSKDDGQCRGHCYGFVFFGTGLHLHWGKSHGTRDDPFTIIHLPWAWRYVKDSHKRFGALGSHHYTYTLRSGEVQQRIATVQAEQCEYWRPWFPWYRVDRRISVTFNKEVGERTGSWKGGVTGCGYDLRENETPLMALRRMESERKF